VIQDASDIGVWTEVFHPEAATAMASLSSMSDIALPASLTPAGKEAKKASTGASNNKYGLYRTPERRKEGKKSF
jgi:hypothetical protein